MIVCMDDPALPSADPEKAARLREQSRQLVQHSQHLHEDAESLKNAFDKLIEEARELSRRSKEAEQQDERPVLPAP